MAAEVAQTPFARAVERLLGDQRREVVKRCAMLIDALLASRGGRGPLEDVWGIIDALHITCSEIVSVGTLDFEQARRFAKLAIVPRGDRERWLDGDLF